MALTAGSAASLTLSGATVSAVKNFGTGLNSAQIAPTLPAINLNYGVGSGAAAFNWGSVGVRTVVSGTPDLIDLTTTLLAPDGSTCNFSEIVALVAVNPAASTGNLVLGNAGSNAWAALLGATGLLTILPGFFFATGGAPASGGGYTVDSTHKILQVTSSSGTINYQLFALGH